MLSHDGARAIVMNAHRFVLDGQGASHEHARAPLVEVERGDCILILLLLSHLREMRESPAAVLDAVVRTLDWRARRKGIRDEGPV